MPSNVIVVRSQVTKYPGMAGWFFFFVPKATSAAIKKTYGAHARGWGSLPVMATLGKTTWKSSIFPDKKSATYLLPLKAAVRKKENVGEKDTVTVTLTLLP